MPYHVKWWWVGSSGKTPSRGDRALSIDRTQDAAVWPVGDDEMAGRIRSHDWSGSPFGPLAAWPQSLRTLVEMSLASPLPIALICGAEQLLLYNDACARLMGDSHPDALGCLAFSFPEGLSDAGPIHGDLLAGEARVFHNRPWVFEQEGKLTTGYFDAYFTPVRNEGGRVAYVHASILPGSPVPAAASDAMPASPQVGDSPDALLLLDVDQMRVEYASPALQRILGEKHRAPVSDFRLWADLLVPEDRPVLDEHLARSAAGAHTVASYRIVRRSDEKVVHVRHSSFPAALDERPGRRIASLIQDVTQSARATARLEEERERFRLLIQSLPQLVWRSADDGLWTWASPQWLAFTGQTQEQSNGWGWLDAIHPDDRQATMLAWHEARPHGTLDVRYRVHRASDGAWRWVQTRSLPRRAAPTGAEPDGRIIEWIGISTDVDDLTRMERELDDLATSLERRTAGMRQVIRALANVDPAEVPDSPGGA